MPCKAAHIPYPPPLGTQFSSQFTFSWLIHAFLMKMSESNQQREANQKFFPERANALEKVVPGEVEILSYITHIGMCRPEGYVFFAVLV